MSLFGTSRYLAKEDVGNGSILTIKEFTQENVAKQNDAPEMKYVMKFHETPKGLVMKPVLGQMLMMLFNLQEEDQILTHLSGQQVALYNDKTVAMGGRFVGGTRIRLPQAGDIPFAADHQPPQPQGFRPDPRQTPAPIQQQPPQPAPRPAAPRPPLSPTQQPLGTSFGVPNPPRPPASVPRPPAMSGYAQPASPAIPSDDAPWPTDGSI